MKKHTLTTDAMKRIYLLKFPEQQREKGAREFDEMLNAHVHTAIAEELYTMSDDDDQTKLLTWFFTKLIQDDMVPPETSVDKNETLQNALKAILEGHGYPVSLLGFILPVLREWEQSQQ